MSKCDLGISFDGRGRSCSPGERISGRVRVEVNAECECKALTLVMEWRTHGRGNGNSGGRVERLLFQGSWPPGTILDYPFEFTAPDGPFTYHGELLNVDWYVAARADVPWALDPKAAEEFLLVPGPSPAGDPQGSPSPGGGAAASPVPGGAFPWPVSGCLILFLAPFVLAGLAAILLGGLTLAGMVRVNGGEGPVGAAGAAFIVFGTVFAGVPGLFIYRLMRNRLASSRLGPVELKVVPGSLRPGGTVACRVSFRPTAAAEMEGVEAVLTGREVVVSGSGTRRTTSTHEFFRRDVSLAGPRSVRPGMAVACEGTLALPPDAVPSFAAADNAVSWSVRATIKVRNWPDWEDAVPLTVRP